MKNEIELNELEQEVVITVNDLELNGILALPAHPKGLILFAHGSGSGRFSPRNNFVARELQKAQFGTLLMDLLSEKEENIDNRKNVFDIDLLSNRLNLAKNWLMDYFKINKLKIGFFGASTGAGAAIEAAAKDPNYVFAIVSRGGRPDLAYGSLARVSVPTLLIVGGADGIVIDINQEALDKMKCKKELVIIPRATHLFEEAGALEKVAELAVDWFTKYC